MWLAEPSSRARRRPRAPFGPMPKRGWPARGLQSATEHLLGAPAHPADAEGMATASLHARVRGTDVRNMLGASSDVLRGQSLQRSSSAEHSQSAPGVSCQSGPPRPSLPAAQPPAHIHLGPDRCLGSGRWGSTPHGNSLRARRLRAPLDVEGAASSQLEPLTVPVPVPRTHTNCRMCRVLVQATAGPRWPPPPPPPSPLPPPLATEAAAAAGHDLVVGASSWWSRSRAVRVGARGGASRCKLLLA